MSETADPATRPPATLSFPADDQRHFICGMTGSGKTVFALWCLSRRSWDRRPWIIVDSKRDPMIARLPRVTEVRPERVPRHKGLYVTRPLPDDFADGTMSRWLMQCWKRGGIGVFIDEGYSFHPRDRALQTVLTQGRSKQIPMIALAQRPAHVSPFLLSESEYKSIFFLQTPTDIDRVQEWLPERDEFGHRIDPSTLPPHCSYWYCLTRREFRSLGPCPGEEAVLDLYEGRNVRRWFL